MKILQKFIVSIIIISLILGLNFNLFPFKPKTAQAGADIIGGPFQIFDTIKQGVLDPISKFAAKPFGQILFYELGRLLRGEFSDENRPLAILDWKQFLREAVDRGQSRFVQELRLTPLCAPIRVSLCTLLGLDPLCNVRAPYSYRQYAACTFEDIGINISEFFKNPSIGMYGWDTWTALTQPQNNIFGSFFLATNEQARMESEEREGAMLEGQAGQGFRDRTECITEATREVPDQIAYNECVSVECAFYEEWSPDYESCVSNCWLESTKEEPSGVCLEYRVKNVGTELHRMIEKQLDFDIDFLIAADELEDLFSMLVTTILSGITKGPGWGTAQSSAMPESWTYKTYKKDISYYQLKQQPPTAEEREKIRNEILNNIYDAIQSFSNQTKECEEKQSKETKGQMPERMESEMTRLENNLVELLEAFTQQFYFLETGIALQPDFKVLDPSGKHGDSPDVYGKTWDEIDFHFYPPKCEKFGRKCSEFDSGLPTWETYIGQDCKTCFAGEDEALGNCKRTCGYDEECLKTCTPEKAKFIAVTAGKCPNVAFANTCRDKLRLVNRTKNSCDDCIQKTEDSCESQKTEEEKSACIERFCENEELGLTGQEFYKKCEIKERHDVCFMCLKQYFMPATYAEKIRDYIARGFVKHPMLIVEKKFERINDDKFKTYYYNYSIGGTPDAMLEDIHCQTFESSQRTRAERDLPTTCTAKCFNNSGLNEVPVGLICRTFPDSGICQRACDISKLTKDPADFLPSDADCNYQGRIGAFDPLWIITNAVFRNRSKFCRALTGHIPDWYIKCTEPYDEVIEKEGPEPPLIADFCPLAVFNCRSWDWHGKNWIPDNIRDLGGLSNIGTTYKNKYINQTVQPRAAWASRLAQAEVISFRASFGAEMYIAKPYCWKPQDCCVGSPAIGTSFSYNNCSDIKSKCKYNQTEINSGYTHEGAKVPSGKKVGDLKTMWVSDPKFTDENNWSAYGYCTTNPESPSDISAFIHPGSEFAWNEGRHIILFNWDDHNQSGDGNNSDNCAAEVSRAIDLSTYAGNEFWVGLHKAQGGVAICVPK